MQRLIRAEKGQLGDVDLDDPMTFHYPIDYVIRTWLDHRKHGSYPETGGYNDQDPLLMQDWHTMNLYHARVEHGIVQTMTFDTHNAVSLDELAGG